METNQDTSEVTNSTGYELKKGEDEGGNQIVMIHIDFSECSKNANAKAAATSSRPHAKEGYTTGAPSSSSRVRPPPPFLLKVYEIVRNPETDSIISWNSTGTSFIVWDPHRFAAEVLGKFFRHNNFSSFICQLNTYGFKKVNWDRLEFQNEWFQRGRRSWLKKIKRRTQNTKIVRQPRVIENAGEFTMFEKQKELEKLMNEHDAFKVEMMKLKERQENLNKEMATLQKQGEFIISKRVKMLKFMVQEVLMQKKQLQRTNVANRQRSNGQESTQSSTELLDEGETYKTSPENSPNTQGTPVQEKDKCSIPKATVPDFSTASYAKLEEQLMEDMNCDNVPEEERSKLQPNVVIDFEDLIAGPADWTEFAKKLGNKAKFQQSKS